MLTNQELFNKSCDSLRTYGNQFGSFISRGWGWCNQDNPKERCAIARFVEGNTNYEITANLKEMLGGVTIQDVPLVTEIINLFDHYPEVCNNKKVLEQSLQTLADRYNLVYTAPIDTTLEIKQLAQVEA